VPSKAISSPRLLRRPKLSVKKGASSRARSPRPIGTRPKKLNRQTSKGGNRKAKGHKKKLEAVLKKFKAGENLYDTIKRAKESKGGVPVLKRDKEMLAEVKKSEVKQGSKLQSISMGFDMYSCASDYLKHRLKYVE